MHCRFSSCKGLPVVEDHELQIVGTLRDILIHPDTGKVEGFFVQVQTGVFAHSSLFLASIDILRFTTRVYVRRADVLSPIEDVLRLHALMQDPRPILGQRIKTEAGAVLGKCMDVQFDTGHFTVEWLFPKKWWQWGLAIPISEVLEVRKDAIIVKNPLPAKEEVAEEKAPILPPIPEAA